MSSERAAAVRTEYTLLKEKPHRLSERVRFVVFLAYFLSSLVVFHSFQLVALPLFVLLPDVYTQLVTTRIKAGFGAIIVSLCAWFGHSDLVITFDDDIRASKVVNKDSRGNITGFNWAKKSIWIANHQQYGDWLYLWILMGYGNIATGLQIILKASLRWAPIVGPAMQLFRFAFIDKSMPLQRAGVDRYARDAKRTGQPYSLLLFPEGTLVSRLTRPKSAAYAKTTGVADFRNTLVPRSTGLLYCLRTLLSIEPDLTMYDATIGYTGVPDQGYAQDYYTLLSIFGRGLSPRSVHIHLRKIDTTRVPCGRVTPNVRAAHLEQELTEKDREAFSKWTYDTWKSKDDLMTDFYKTGRFPAGTQGEFRMPIKLRRQEWLDLLVLPCIWSTFVLVVWRFLRS